MRNTNTDTRTEIQATFDTLNETWNIIRKSNRDCLFYTSAIEELEQWLLDHANTHVEDYACEYTYA